MMEQTALAIDIGGSKLVVGLVTRNGQILAKQRRVWTRLTEEGVLDDILAATQELLSAHPQGKPALVGVTIPGLADPRQGLWVEASFSGIRNFPIAARLCQGLRQRLRLDAPVFVQNDAKACALAELLFGGGKGLRDFVYLTVSNGIGGAIVADGRLLEGAFGFAGEIGHCTVVEQGRPCKCGKQGCLEVYGAGPGLTRTYEELGGKPLPEDGPAGAVIAERAAAGDAAARQALTLEGQYLGRAIAFAANLLNPQKMIIGGGLSLIFDAYAPSLRQTVAQQVYATANHALVIEPTQLGYDGGLLGAAALAFCGA